MARAYLARRGSAGHDLAEEVVAERQRAVSQGVGGVLEGAGRGEHDLQPARLDGVAEEGGGDLALRDVGLVLDRDHRLDRLEEVVDGRAVAAAMHTAGR